MTVIEKLARLRSLMKNAGVSAYIISSSDAHQSEYVCPHWRSREWISGFDGSAGTVVVTLDEAGLWADGRYYIQAASQLEGSTITLFKSGLDGVPTYQEWLCSNLKKDDVVGFDGRTISAEAGAKLLDELSKKNITANPNLDLVGDMWEDRPTLPNDAAFLHKLKFTGKTVSDKLSLVREKMEADGVAAYLISSLDDICWLFNMRGNDVKFLPVVYSYAFIERDLCYLFVDKKKLSNELEDSFKGVVGVKGYDEITSFLKAYKPNGKVFINPGKVSMLMKGWFSSDTEFREGKDYTSLLKAVKNETEIANTEECQVKDGVAMVNFLYWLKNHLKSNTISEADISDKLLEFRNMGEYCIGASFSTIAAYMGNAAMMHYSPVRGKCAEVKGEGMLLIDSGGQYYDGTTDITRTVILGKITDEMKTDFTLVLKAHISLASAKFLYGATGGSLDYAARKPMWDRGIDYKSGTGHGVGYFLSVHEGPQGIGMRASDVKLEAGMNVTNEPGIYKEGRWGIRTENMMLVTEDFKNENGCFMKFKPMTYCPIDLAGIDAEMLSDDERDWLNSYHSLVYEKLSERLGSDQRAWLKEATKELCKN